MTGVRMMRERYTCFSCLSEARLANVTRMAIVDRFKKSYQLVYLHIHVIVSPD